MLPIKFSLTEKVSWQCPRLKNQLLLTFEKRSCGTPPPPPPSPKNVSFCSFKYGYLNVRQRIIMNVDLEDPQSTQRASKILFDLCKERIK